MPRDLLSRAIIVRDDLWLCVDCLLYACNGDLSGIDHAYGADAEKRAAAVQSGVAALGPHLVPDFDAETGEGMREFSRCGCDACGSRLAGAMHRFAILGEGIDGETISLTCEIAPPREPLGMEERVRYRLHTVDGTEVLLTLPEFLRDNAELPPSLIDEIRLLAPGETLHDGGGAAPEWSITREPST